MRIDLPWPDKRLSSNARVHWAQKRKATADARLIGNILTLNNKTIYRRITNPKRVRFTYHPPDKRRRDAQNMPAMLKAYIDGIADALGVDDSTFECVFPSKFAEPVKGGKIVVEIE